MADPASRVPTAALVLGGLGALPFVALASGLPLPLPMGRGLLARALVGYGAAILSFMGGVHWGAAMVQAPRRSDPRAFGLSVLPALAGWACLLLPTAFALPGLAGAFVLLLAYDLWTAHKGETPAWYPRLRIPLSLVVIASLLAAAISAPPPG